jgi:hypothetical protein
VEFTEGIGVLLVVESRKTLEERVLGGYGAGTSAPQTAAAVSEPGRWRTMLTLYRTMG